MASCFAIRVGSQSGREPTYAENGCSIFTRCCFYWQSVVFPGFHVVAVCCHPSPPPRSLSPMILPGACASEPQTHIPSPRHLRSYGIENDVDFVAASFVRKAEDVRSIRRFIAKVHSKHWPEDRPTARIISKIENLGEAVVEFAQRVSSHVSCHLGVWASKTSRGNRLLPSWTSFLVPSCMGDRLPTQLRNINLGCEGVLCEVMSAVVKSPLLFGCVKCTYVMYVDQPASGYLRSSSSFLFFRFS